VRRAILPVLLPVLLCGAALPAMSAPGHPAARPAHNPDPFERFNRAGFALNQALDKALIRPFALLSRGLTPGPIGHAIRNFLSNLGEPVVILNDVLQVRPVRAVKTSVRLVVNTTVGLLGAIDVAQHIGIRFHPNGFGDTLGRYGVGPGPYLFLPLLGPSDVRDLVGAGVDSVSTPLFWAEYNYKTEIDVSLGLAGGLSQRSEADADLKALLSDAADPYATLRSTYLQDRQGEIDEKHTLPPLPDIGDPEPATPPPAASAEATPAVRVPEPDAPASAQLATQVAPSLPTPPRPWRGRVYG
jgi:phospholipid-binding lipoprotein MlaA